MPKPDNPQIFNRYAYVGNNPIGNTDPDGHCYPVCTVAIGAAIGAVVGVGLYAANVASSGQNWSWSEAGVAATGGAIAGGLIGTGVGIAAGASALAVTGAGVGMASAGGGYMVANTITGNEFKSTDFAITAGIGAGTGAIAPVAATTVPSAVALNATANALTYEATTYANTGSLAFDEGLAWSIGTGAGAGLIGGPATPFNKITVESTDEYAKQFGQAYGSKVSGPNGISFDPNLFPDQVSKGIWRETKAGAGRTISSGITANSPCYEDVCQ